MKKKNEIETKNIPSSSVVRILQKCRSRVGEREKRESWGRERKNSSPILCSILRPDSSSFSPIALADVDGHVASDEFLRRPRQRMCHAGSGFRQFERWEWICTLLKRSRCTVSFPLIFIQHCHHHHHHPISYYHHCYQLSSSSPSNH